MGRWIACGMLVLALMGCGNQAAQKMAGGERAAYPEFDGLASGSAMMGIGYAKTAGDLKKAVADEGLAKGVAAFESSTLPAGYDQAAKDALVKAYKDLIEAGKSGSGDDIKAKLDAVRAATSKFAADPTAPAN